MIDPEEGQILTKLSVVCLGGMRIDIPPGDTGRGNFKREVKEMEKQTFYEEKMIFSYSPEKEVEVIRVVRTTLMIRGEGNEKDPIRRIEQFWSLDGKLLAENDPCLKNKEEE